MTTIVDGTTGVTFPDSTVKATNVGPTVTVLTSGSGTYTTPTGAKWLEIEVIGGGGGGASCGPVSTGGTAGTAGSSSTFGSIITCAGGAAGGALIVGLDGGLGGAGGSGVIMITAYF